MARLKVEGGFEVVKRALNRRTFLPITNGIGEEAGCFQIFEAGTDCDRFRDGVDRFGEDTTKFDLLPEVFDRLVGAP